MVGIVIVSHSEKLAEGIKDLASLMANEVPIAAAGGLLDGSFGTSFDKIKEAIESVYSPDGVILLMDMGSALMTTEMVIESLGLTNVKMADAPVVEGAVTAAVSSFVGKSIDEIISELSVKDAFKKIL